MQARQGAASNGIERFGGTAPRGAAGIMLLFAFPFGFALLGKRTRYAAILLTTAVLYFVLWAFSFQNVRYYVHIFPMICVLGAATVFHFNGYRWSAIINRICLVCVLVFQFPATSMELWNIPERFPLTAALGMETREEFLRRSLGSYTGAVRLNALVKPGERIVGVNVEDVRFYLTAPLETLADSARSSVLRPAGTMSNEKLLATLRQSGFSYVFATRELLRDPPIGFPYLNRKFLDHFATLFLAMKIRWCIG